MLLALAACWGGAAPAAADSKAKGQVVIVVVGGLSLLEVRDGPMPFTRSLVERSALGLTNTLGVGKADMERSSATIGAGARARIETEVEPAMNAGEAYEDGTAADAYRRRTGFSADGYSVVDVGLAELDATNRGLSYHMIPGALGDAVTRGGGETAAFGNSDTSVRPGEGETHRSGVYVAMDARGRVRYGDVGKAMLRRAKGAPFGVTAATERLVGGYRRVRDRATMVVLEFGDIARAERFRHFAMPRVAANSRRAALQAADDFLRDLAPELRRDATLMVVSPVGPDEGGANSLTPIILAGEKVKPGSLSSPVTQRRGLINATDIAPTVLKVLGLPPRTEFLGATMASDGGGEPARIRISRLATLYDRASAEAALRSTVTSIFTLAVTLVFACVVALLFSSRVSAQAVAASRWLLVGVVSAPLAAYMMWLVRPPNSPRSQMIGAFVVFLVLIPTLALARAKEGGTGLGKVCAATVLFIFVDQIGFGGQLIMSTFYGYSPVDGARYYGIGNETWAIMIGALLVATALWVQVAGVSAGFVKWGVPAVFAAAVVVIGFPALGANAGGVIGATAALSAMYLHLRDRRIGWKQGATVALAIVVVLGAFTAYDVLRPANVETHIGRSARLVTGKNGAVELALLAQRKLTSNLKVMQRTRWSYVLLVILAVLAVLRRRPTGLMAETLSRQPGLAAGLTGALVGGLVGLLTEDSGVVIPAMLLLFMGSALTMAMVETKAALQSETGLLKED